MKEYKLSGIQRLAIKSVHREFQAAVAIVANSKVGYEINCPEGVFVYSGGVNVNGHDIVIKKDYVYDGGEDIIDRETREKRPASVEETAVVEAIQELAAPFKINERITGTGERSLEPYAPMAGKLGSTDPLRDMLAL